MSDDHPFSEGGHYATPIDDPQDGVTLILQLTCQYSEDHGEGFDL
jgi:hypothetical protein